MKKLPVLQISKDAYTFLFTETKKIFPMFIQYSTSMLLLYVFLHLVKDKFASPAGAAPSAVAILILLLTYMFLAPFLQMPLTISMVRAMVNREEIGKDYFNLLLASRTRRTFLTMISTTLLLFAALAGTAAVVAGLLFIVSSFNLQEIGLKFFTILFITLGVIFILYVCARLFLAVPSTALDREKPIRHSWKISKGHIIRILGIFFLTFLPSIAWGSIVSILFNVSFQTNPLAYGFLTLPQLYLGFILYAGLGLVYKHIDNN